jgi:hypothetical protein
MLFNQRTVYVYILPTDSPGRLRSNKLQSRAVSCELLGGIISLYPNMSRNLIQLHHMPGRDIIQRLLDPWRRSDGLESFQSRLTIRADMYFSGLLWNWMSWTHPKIAYISAWKTEPFSHRLPIDSAPVPYFILDPSVNQTSPLTDYRRSPSSFGPILPSQHSNLIFGFKIECRS